MKVLSRTLLLAIFLLASASAGTAGAQTLYGLSQGDVKLGTSSLNIIDQNTGVPTLVGETGFTDCTGLDFNQTTGELFGVCEDEGGGVLIRINPNTGQGTYIGALNIEEFGFVRDISFRSDGRLYAYVASKPEDFLGVIDTDTGNFTKLGNTGLFFNAAGMAFSLSDILYLAGTDLGDYSLFTLNQEDGSSTFETIITFPPPPGRFLFLSSDTNPVDGVFFTTYRSGESTYTLSTIDMTTGDLAVIGEIEGTIVNAIAFIGPRITNVPTLSEYGLILAAVVFLSAALLILRRRKSSGTI